MTAAADVGYVHTSTYVSALNLINLGVWSFCPFLLQPVCYKQNYSRGMESTLLILLFICTRFHKVLVQIDSAGQCIQLHINNEGSTAKQLPEEPTPREEGGLECWAEIKGSGLLEALLP